MKNQAKYTDVIYHEVQRLRQVWLWVSVLFITGLMWYTVIMQLLFHTPVGTKPMSDPQAFVFWLIFGLGFPILFFNAKLETVVLGDGILVRFFPFLPRTKKVAFTELKSCEAKTYRPLLEYGGWGIRLGAKGWAYNTSGREGVELQLRDGRILLIGSQRSEELYQAIQSEIDRTERQGSIDQGAS